MKKIFAAILCSIIFVQVPAAYAADTDIWLEDEGYFFNAAELAQMLKDLGLFQGKRTGFALEEAMTRAEAAVMTVRFLGEETAVLAGDWTHPFTDVPAWADKYVGWLWQNGFTQGISAAEFGAARNITGEEYETLLLRALTDMQSAPAIKLYLNETYDRYPQGFTRSAAVHTSYRALRLPYTRSGEAPHRTTAQYLVDKGVFTPAQLGAAVYALDPVFIHPEETDGKLTYIVFGVQTAEASEYNLTLDERSLYYAAPFFYAYQHSSAGTAIYQLDPVHLQAEKIGIWSESMPDESMRFIGITQSRDIFAAMSAEGYVKAVFSYDGTAFIKELDIQHNAAQYKFSVTGVGSYTEWSESVYLSGPKHVLFLTKGKEPLWVDVTETARIYPVNATCFVTFSKNQNESVISSYRMSDGSQISSFSVPQQGETFEEWRDVIGYFYEQESIPFFGSAGHYVLDTSTGVLTQITDSIVDASPFPFSEATVYTPLLAARAPEEPLEQGSRIMQITPAGE